MKVPESILDAIRAHGRETYPEECCGFLLGSSTAEGNVVTSLYRVDNKHEKDRDRRYTITPQDYVRADHEAGKNGLDIVGTYHSHPDHPARPSQTDLNEATFAGFTYVIVSVHRGEPVDLTAWTLAEDRSQFLSEAIEVQRNEPQTHEVNSINQ